MKREFLFSLTKKDFIIEALNAGGSGGQHQNRTYSAIRIKHPASGAVGESREERSQHANKKIAFKRLTETEKFKKWLKIKCAQISSGKTIEEIVEEITQEQFIKTKQKMRKSHIKNNHQQGEKNSQYGTCWIYNKELKQNKLIKREKLDIWLKEGWFKGRKMRF
jgi:protein subunit release factor B